MNIRDLQQAVRASPGACALLVARTRLSAEKQARTLDDMLPLYLRQGAKLQSALESVEGLSIKRVFELIEDERDDFLRARMQESYNNREKEEFIAAFVSDVTSTAESVLPGIYFDGVAA